MNSTKMISVVSDPIYCALSNVLAHRKPEYSVPEGWTIKLASHGKKREWEGPFIAREYG